MQIDRPEEGDTGGVARFLRRAFPVPPVRNQPEVTRRVVVVASVAKRYLNIEIPHDRTVPWGTSLLWPIALPVKET